MSYKEDDADYVIANLNRANEILRARVVELEAQLATVNDELKLARKGAEFCFKQAKDADANATVQVEARKFFEAQLAERDRSVVKANEQAERFEREWYLRGDELDEAKKLLLLAKDALEKVREVTGSNTFAHNYADEALAAINDSKLVEGMILCDAKPVAYQEGNPDGIWFVAFSINEKAPQVPLYAPRRTEK